MARFLLGLLVFAALASPASASTQFGDLDVDFLSLKVNDRGEALVSYRRADGARRDVLIWGAVNAHAPGPRAAAGEVPDGLRRRPAEARLGVCRLVPGPVPAVRRPAPRHVRRRLQGARRLLLGVAALAADRADARLRPVPARAPGRRAPRLALDRPAARARGLAELDVRRPPAGAVRPSHLPRRGRARLPDSVWTRSDPYARFVYIDTFNSVYGPGWKRDTGIVTHLRNGAFCYSFVAQAPPPGYPSKEPRGPGNGERHRVSVMGPGVTPVRAVGGQGPGPLQRSRGPGLQQALRPVGRAGRQGLHPRALDRSWAF